MIRAEDELNDLLHVQEHLRTITHRTTGATLKVVAADAETASGKKASGVLVDELWLFGKRANAETMLREATGGLASRPEGFVIYLSTQSDQPPAGVFAQILKEFRGIRDGKINDPRSMGLLYEYPACMLKAEAFRNPDKWYITNPNLGASVDLQYLLDECGKAERAGEASVRGFSAKHLKRRNRRRPPLRWLGRRCDMGSRSRARLRLRRGNRALRGGDDRHRWRRAR